MDKINEISEVLSNTKDKVLIETFLKSILTDNEINEISSRWEIVKLLYDGMSQRSISDKLGVSLCKITRGSRELKKEPSSFKIMMQKYLEK